MSIDFSRTYGTAVGELRRMEAESGIQLAMIEESTVRDDRGWIFYWNTEGFVERGDDQDPIAGNAPIVILKDGTVGYAPTAFTDASSIFEWLSDHPKRDR